MANVCLGNLLQSSILAYDNIDLIPNGYIKSKSTAARPSRVYGPGETISNKEIINVLPSDRIYAEFQFSVRSRVTGTNLGDLGQGAFATLGLLGLGSGAVASSLACFLQGDSERVASKFVFHVCESSTFINQEIVLTEDDVKTGTLNLPNYIAGVLGVTSEPIQFVSPTVPLTQEQIQKAKNTSAEQVEATLGRRVAPEDLTESDMRLLLGISEINELENLGNSSRATRGWPQQQNGQIQGEFQNFKYNDSYNRFVEIIRDPRKNKYRSDNEFDKDSGHCFWNGSYDDLTDKTIKIKIKIDNQDQSLSENTKELKQGDKVYVTYVGVTNPIFRHAVYNSTIFFLFPDQSAYQLPPLDFVRGWNFKKFSFKVKKNKDQRAFISDLIDDAKIQAEIANVNSGSLSSTEKEAAILKLKNSITLEDIECQRLIEAKLEKSQRQPYIKGIYFIDSRGIIKLDLRNGSNTEDIIVPYSQIRDKQWFDSLLDEIVNSSPPNTFFEDKVFNFNFANLFFDDFLFDVSDHVNSCCYDNEKFGYERRFANGLKRCSRFNAKDPSSGIGAANLDLLINGLAVSNDVNSSSYYDLTTAEFNTVTMQGSAAISTCNSVFTYDFGFCTKGTIQSDMLLRTPIFFSNLSQKTRIYVEQFSPQNPLQPSGGVWVGTKPRNLTDSYAVTLDNSKMLSFLVYPENDTLKYKVFEDAVLNKQYTKLAYKLPSASNNANKLDDINEFFDQKKYDYKSYDKILGSQPSVFRGNEISITPALILNNKASPSLYKIENLKFSQDYDKGRVSVESLSGKKINKIYITYTPKSKQFLEIENRFFSLVSPVNKYVIDNIDIAYEGKFTTQYSRQIDIYSRYLNSENFFLVGEVLKYININSIQIEYITDEDYEKQKITTANISTCFDVSGNWLIFFEDNKAYEGALTSGAGAADGSKVSEGDKKDYNFPGLNDKQNTEISCLFSPNQGDTWYLHRGVVRTVVGDEVSSPRCCYNKKTNKVHLFFVLNNCLFQKIIDPNSFLPQDSFLGYKRPFRLDEKTVPLYGLFHFSNPGRILRQSPMSLVIGNINSDFIKRESTLYNKNISVGRNDYRIYVANNDSYYVNDLSYFDYIAYVDTTGSLNVLFAASGKLFFRRSANQGLSWNNVIPSGVLIHKNSLEDVDKSIKNLGFAYNEKDNKLYLTYQVDDVLFVKKIEGNFASFNEIDIVDQIGPKSSYSRPIFVTGFLSNNLKQDIQKNTSLISFPYTYNNLDAFGDNYSISLNASSLGCVFSTGNIKFFYKDSLGNFKGFVFKDSSISLDSDYY